MRILAQDFWHGVRILARSPGFTLVAVLALALGIGANTAIFSVVYGVLLRPLAFPQPDRLVMLWGKAPKLGYPKMFVSASDFLDWRAQNHVFEDIALARPVGNFNLSGTEEPERLQGTYVSASLFALLGVRPLIGRTFSAEQEQPGRNRVVVLSYSLWQRRFGADPGIAGKSIRLNGEPHTVLGVMPREFQYPAREFEIWAPVEFNETDLKLRVGYNFLAVARLKPGVDMRQAQAEMDTIAARLAGQYPKSNEGLSVGMAPLRDAMVGDVRMALLVLLGAVFCVLLIACVNVANLLIARAVARQRELTIRTALGAGRARLIAQMAIENVPLLALGTGLGIVLALWGVDGLTRLLPAGMPRASEIGVNAPVLAFTLALAVFTGLLFGLAPALSTARVDLTASLKEDARSGGPRAGLRQVLVVSEIALALVLLVGAGLLARSFERLQMVNAGLRPDHVLTMQLALSPGKYAKQPQIAAFLQQLVERVRILPGVDAAGVVNRLPLTGIQQTGMIAFEDANLPLREILDTDWRSASPDYFRALGIPLLRGRFFTEADAEGAPNVGIIDERIASRVWPGQNPIGKRFKLGKLEWDIPWTTIVGVVGHIRNDSLDTDPRAQVYWSYLQRPQNRMALVVRTRGEPTQLASAVRGQVRSVDPDQPVYDMRSMEDVVSRSVAQRRLTTLLLGIFAGLALVLAAIGIYGVISYSVSRRTREVGIRMALGARQGDVQGMVVRQGLLLALAGVGVGVAASLALTRVLAGMLFGITATDPLTFGGVSVFLVGVALAAAWVPARRAARTDPMVALRYE